MKIKTKKIIYVIICILIVLSSSLTHEFAHQEIYSSYHIDSNVTLSTTSPSQPCPDNSYCTFSHDLNEIFNYNLAPFLIFFMVAFYFLIFKENENK